MPHPLKQKTMSNLAIQSSPVSFGASKELAEILYRHRFVEVEGMGGATMRRVPAFQRGVNHYFRKHGQCTVHFLKDGRIHILQGPIAMWNLHDELESDELAIVLAFSAMCEEHQDLMRSYMGPRCKRYVDIWHHMPSFQVDWKQQFLQQFLLVTL